MEHAQLQPVRFSDLPGWESDDHGAALAAFRRSAHQVLVKPYRTGALGLSMATLEPAFAEARSDAVLDPRAFFERHFVPLRLAPKDRASGFVTGFYEPVVEASAARTAQFTIPLLTRPLDLVDVEPNDPPPGVTRGYAFSRRTAAGYTDFPDRAAIEGGALAGQGLELAWLRDPVDAFFIHVQGAARLRMTSGEVRRITYAAKSGHPFTGPGGVLAELGEIPREAVTMQSIRAWFKAHPGRVAEILHRNRSYIFFREAEVADPELGPVAAAKVPLTPGRSLAVDRLIHTFGTPFFIDAPTLDAFGGAPFRRLMIAQDTGSAIVGAARGDLFAGSGDAAGEIAGVIRHEAGFTMLAPRAFAQQAVS